MTVPTNILILDSGAGGLSIAKEIVQLHPHVDITCIADNAAYPYGSMPDHELTTRLLYLIKKFEPLVKPNIIVIACNTASTIALDALRKNFDIPFIGVVPAIKPAAKISKTGAIGVLATPATVARPYTHQLIESHAKHIDVHLHGSQKLVHEAEKLIKGLPVNENTLKNELTSLVSQKNTIDTVVLACTHFPLLKTYLQSIEQFKHIHWEDSGKAIANRVTYWLDELGVEVTSADNRLFSLIYTDHDSGDADRRDPLKTFIQQTVLNHKNTENNCYQIVIELCATPYISTHNKF